jgi:lipopolysaccharide transport system ATP-binding protein
MRWGTGFRKEAFWALRDVSFEVKRGEVIGIIGRNGAGKSTLLKILSRITEPTEGTITIKGRVASLLEVGTGFHPELSGRENVYLNGAILGMSRAEIRRKFDEIVAFAEVEKFLDTQVKHYSSGMYVRLAFAVAAHLEPEILIVDEVLAVGDAQFQQKCLGKMEKVASGGRTILFVSHNTAAIAQLCSSGLLLENGGVGHRGSVSDCLKLYSTRIDGANARLIDGLQNLDPRVKITRLLINENSTTVTSIRSGQRTLPFEIDLDVREAIALSVEVSLREQFGGALAIFSPGHFEPESGLLALGIGQHRLRAQIQLPSLHRGAYIIDFFLTRPGVTYYARAQNLCTLHHEGTVTPNGVVFDQSAQGAGFLMLPGTIAVET